MNLDEIILSKEEIRNRKTPVELIEMKVVISGLRHKNNLTAPIHYLPFIMTRGG